MKPSKFMKKQYIASFLAQIGWILMKKCQSDAELYFLSTGTNENCTTTPKTIKTKKNGKQNKKQKRFKN